ncbi:hypothetical protein [Candidatus Reidiella endopervernicosa]|uniref:Uncharacterized protein n=1 Tax=Candidatus Reidiella endopervernicosa TaxID=2738883 RepID=A0A6N0HXQ9_9GAMM|nr:hypothetical protein [Candidatus Reidiella endopervernicosa]QKQ27118.1 hypothetical protein HUE57_13105 [Candidatus Reidiella endopervernicosa]
MAGMSIMICLGDEIHMVKLLIDTVGDGAIVKECAKELFTGGVQVGLSCNLSYTPST